MQLAQACHAVSQLCISYPDACIEWFEESNNLVVLQVPDEPRLMAWRDVMLTLRAPFLPFYEPDLGDQMTAIAVAPHPVAARHLQMLPLAGRVLAGSG